MTRFELFSSPDSTVDACIAAPIVLFVVLTLVLIASLFMSLGPKTNKEDELTQVIGG